MTPRRTQPAPQLTGIPQQAAEEIRRLAQVVYRLQSRLESYDAGIPQSKVIGLEGELASKVPQSRRIMTEPPLLGGRDLSADLTIHGGAGGGVTSLNGETGAVTLVAGTNVTVTPVGQNITIASTATGFTAGGDLSGTAISQEVIGIQSHAIDGGPTNGDVLVYSSSSGMWEPSIYDGTRKVGINIDGLGSAITTGVKGSIQVDFGGTIIGWSIEADQSGSIQIDVDKHAGTQALPVVPNTSTDKISAAAPIALAAAQAAGVGTAGVVTWTTAVAQWDSIQFNVTSAATIQRVTLWIRIQES